MQFILNKALGDQLIQYLATKPYGEVHQLISALANLSPMPAAKAVSRVSSEVKTELKAAKSE